MDDSKIEATVADLVNPLDNAINEKCPRIKRAFLRLWMNIPHTTISLAVTLNSMSGTLIRNGISG